MSHESFEPPVVVKLYRIYQTLIPHLAKLPKLYRYSLGQTIERALLASLEFIFEANAMPRPLREAPLLRAKAKIELFRLLIRVAFESNLILGIAYFQLVAASEEVLKMLGGWISYVRSGPSSPPPPMGATTAERAPSFRFRLSGSSQFTLT